jgi:UDP-N-acetylmuramyl pentapeptide synthase
MYTEQLYRIFREESSGVSTDTGLLRKGIVFCSVGQNFNGNEYAAEALDKGARMQS